MKTYGSEIDSLKKYVNPPKIYTAFFNSLWIISLVLAVLFLLVGKDTASALVFFVFGIVLLTVCKIKISECSRTKNTINSLDNQGSLPILLGDFRNGGQAFCDSLRLGERYLIGKNTGTIVSYGEITKIYQHIHKKRLREIIRELKIETADGSVNTLCNLPLNGKADSEVAHVISHILSVNSSIQVGKDKTD